MVQGTIFFLLTDFIMRSTAGFLLGENRLDFLFACLVELVLKKPHRLARAQALAVHFLPCCHVTVSQAGLREIPSKIKKVFQGIFRGVIYSSFISQCELHWNLDRQPALPRQLPAEDAITTFSANICC